MRLVITALLKAGMIVFLNWIGWIKLMSDGRPAQWPKEIVATIYESLGVDLHTELPGPQGRPYPVVDFGAQAIKELFA